MEPIKIFKGDDTDFNNSKFLTINVKTEIDLTGFKGIFKLGKFKTEQDMQSKTMEIVIPHEVTALMLNGTHTGIFTLIDTQNRVKTLSNTIPFLVTSEVFTQEEDSIELPVPEGYPYEIIVELGGTNDYNSLQNIPTFEGQPIKGNLTFQSTGIAPLESLDALVQVVNQKANTADVQNACGQLQEQITTNKNDIAGLGDQTAEIEAKIPAEASETNQLADKQFVQDLTSALNLVTWVDTLPETGESKYIYAVPREETDTDGKPIAALYLWDGTRWNGAGAFSLNIDPATLATKTDLTNYLPLTGGTLSGTLGISQNNGAINIGANQATSAPFISFKNNSGVILQLTQEASNFVFYYKYNKRITFTGDGRVNTQNNGNLLGEKDKSIANGVASLDANAKVPSEQIPVATASTLGGVKVEFDETTGILNIKTE